MKSLLEPTLEGLPMCVEAALLAEAEGLTGQEQAAGAEGRVGAAGGWGEVARSCMLVSH